MASSCLRRNTRRWCALVQIEDRASDVYCFTAREVGLNGATMSLLSYNGDVRKVRRLKKPWVFVWRLEKRLSQRSVCCASSDR